MCILCNIIIYTIYNFIINIKYGDNKTLADQGKIYYRVIDGINNVPKKKNNTINKKKYIKHKNVDKQIRLEFKIKEEKSISPKRILEY